MSNEKSPQEVFAALRQIMPTLSPGAREVIQHLPEQWEDVSDTDKAIIAGIAQAMNSTMKDRIAPPGKYRVLGVDKFDDSHWVEDDLNGREEALECAGNKTAQATYLASSPTIATVYYVYDDTGEYLGP